MKQKRDKKKKERNTPLSLPHRLSYSLLTKPLWPLTFVVYLISASCNTAWSEGRGRPPTTHTLFPPLSHHTDTRSNEGDEVKGHAPSLLWLDGWQAVMDSCLWGEVRGQRVADRQEGAGCCCSVWSTWRREEFLVWLLTPGDEQHLFWWRTQPTLFLCGFTRTSFSTGSSLGFWLTRVHCNSSFVRRARVCVCFHCVDIMWATANICKLEHNICIYVRRLQLLCLCLLSHCL